MKKRCAGERARHGLLTGRWWRWLLVLVCLLLLCGPALAQDRRTDLIMRLIASDYDMEATAGRRKQVRPNGKLWTTVLESTGQPSLKNDPT